MVLKAVSQKTRIQLDRQSDLDLFQSITEHNKSLLNKQNKGQ